MSFPVSPTSRIPAKRLLYLGAGLSLLAALFHIWAMQGHHEEWWGYGVFFLALAIAQWSYGLALLFWPGRSLVLVGIGGTLVVIVLYIVNHTTGLPFFGPHAGMPEKIEIVGLVSKALEIALVFTLLGLLQDHRISQPSLALHQQQA